jgi:hypothetical protein
MPAFSKLERHVRIIERARCVPKGLVALSLGQSAGRIIADRRLDV